MHIYIYMCKFIYIYNILTYYLGSSFLDVAMWLREPGRIYIYMHTYVYIHVLCLCVSCVGRDPCVGRSFCVSGALCVGALCVGRSLVGLSPPVSDPFHVDIRLRDGSRSGARSHGL